MLLLPNILIPIPPFAYTGRFQEAMRGAEAIKQTLPDSLLEIPVMNRFFESFLSVELHVLLRFGRWQDILARPIPTNDKVRVFIGL